MYNLLLAGEGDVCPLLSSGLRCNASSPEEDSSLGHQKK